MCWLLVFKRTSFIYLLLLPLTCCNQSLPPTSQTATHNIKPYIKQCIPDTQVAINPYSPSSYKKPKKPTSETSVPPSSHSALDQPGSSSHSVSKQPGSSSHSVSKQAGSGSLSASKQAGSSAGHRGEAGSSSGQKGGKGGSSSTAADSAARQDAWEGLEVREDKDLLMCDRAAHMQLCTHSQNSTNTHAHSCMCRMEEQIVKKRRKKKR